jgi:hypothetical protein
LRPAHSETIHSETIHSETIHSETIHSETIHSETIHSEKAHSEKAHSEKAHSEKAHSEKAHSETGCNCSNTRTLPHNQFDQQRSNQCFGKSIALPKVKQLFFSLKRRKSSSRLRSNCQDRATVALRSSQRPETPLRSASWERNSRRQREATTAPPFTSKVVFGQPATLRLV